MTEHQMQHILAHHYGIRRYVCVPNFSWGFQVDEMDLAVLSGSGYLYEIEIKVSMSDLKREKLKKRWQYPILEKRFEELVSKYYIAVPRSLLPFDYSLLPEIAGLFVVNDSESNIPYMGQVELIRKSRKKMGRPLTIEEQFKLARLGVMRYWRKNDPPS